MSSSKYCIHPWPRRTGAGLRGDALIGLPPVATVTVATGEGANRCGRGGGEEAGSCRASLIDMSPSLELSYTAMRSYKARQAVARPEGGLPRRGYREVVSRGLGVDTEDKGFYFLQQLKCG